MKHPYTINSVILEGWIVSRPEITENEHGVVRCSFALANSRYISDDSPELERTIINVEAFGAVALQIMREGKLGETYRVVGQLRQHKTDNIIIMCQNFQAKEDR